MISFVVKTIAFESRLVHTLVDSFIYFLIETLERCIFSDSQSSIHTLVDSFIYFLIETLESCIFSDSQSSIHHHSNKIVGIFLFISNNNAMILFIYYTFFIASLIICTDSKFFILSRVA